MYDADDLKKSKCTTIPVQPDKSNYWAVRTLLVAVRVCGVDTRFMISLKCTSVIRTPDSSPRCVSTSLSFLWAMVVAEECIYALKDRTACRCKDLHRRPGVVAVWTGCLGTAQYPWTGQFRA